MAVLKRMRLPYLRAAAPEVLATAKAQRWDPPEVLKELLDEEVPYRHDHRHHGRWHTGQTHRVASRTRPLFSPRHWGGLPVSFFGLLEPVARKSGTAGSEGWGALCPEFTRTEGSSARTQGCSVDLGRVDPWVRAQPGGSCSSAEAWRTCRAAAEYRIAVVSSSPNRTARWSGSGPWVSASSS